MANTLKIQVSSDTSLAELGMDKLSGKIDKVSSSSDKMSNKHVSLKKLLRLTTQEIQRMEMQYRALSDADKNSDLGKNLLKLLNELYAKAGDFKDIAADVNLAITNMASDTANWDALSLGIGVTRDVVTAFATSCGIADEKGSLLADTVNTIAKVLGIASAAISIGNALQKQSALITGIVVALKKLKLALLTKETAEDLAGAAATITKTTADGANATAEGAKATATGVATVAVEAETAATGKATIALRIFNAVANANPYVLLATAIVTVVAAIGTWVAISNKHKQIEEEKTRKLELLKRVIDALNAAKAEGIKKSNEEVLKLNILNNVLHNSSTAYNTRKRALEEILKIVPDYHGSLTKEGQLINDNAEAIAKYVTNMKKAAEALATFNAYVNASGELAVKEAELNGVKQQRTTNKALLNKLIAEGKDKEATGSNMSLHGPTTTHYEDTEEMTKLIDADKALAAQEELLTEEIKALKTIVNNLSSLMQKKSEDYIKSLDTGKSGKTKTTTSKSTKLTPEERIKEALLSYTLAKNNADYDLGKGTINTSEYNKQMLSAALSLVNVIKNNTDLSKATAALKKQYDDAVDLYSGWTTLVKADEAALKKKTEAENNLAKAYEKLKDYNTKQENPKIEAKKTDTYSYNGSNSNDATQVEKNNETITTNNEQIDLLVNKLNGLNEVYKNLKDAADNVNPDALKYIEAGAKLADYKKLIDELTLTLANLKAQLADSLNNGEATTADNELINLLTDLLNGLIEKYTELLNTMNGINPDSQKYVEVGEALLETKDDIDSVTESLKNYNDANNQVAESNTNIAEKVKKTLKRVKLLGDAGDAISELGNAFTNLGKAANNKDLEIAGIIALAIANVLLGVGAAIGKAGLSGNPWVWLGFAATAIAEGAAVVALILNLKKNAQGGIIGGTSYSGDSQLIRVNSGEMVLNTRLLRNLFRMLDNGISSNNTGSLGYGEVEFKISGSDLVGVLTTYNKRR